MLFQATKVVRVCYSSHRELIGQPSLGTVCFFDYQSLSPTSSLNSKKKKERKKFETQHWQEFTGVENAVALLLPSCPRPSKDGPQVELLRENVVSVRLRKLGSHFLAEKNLEGPFGVASRVENVTEFLEELDVLPGVWSIRKWRLVSASCQEKSELDGGLR